MKAWWRIAAFAFLSRMNERMTDYLWISGMYDSIFRAK